MKINPDRATVFVYSKYLPQLIMAQNKDSVYRVDRVLKDIQFNFFNIQSEDDFMVQEQLRNIIVFYNEKGYLNNNQTFDILKHLHDIHGIEKLYRDTPARKGIDAKLWHSLRCPYIKIGA